MKPPTMWCVQGPSGRLLIQTLDLTNDGALYKLFDYMPESFRTNHWKNIKSSKRAYKRLGYRALKVKLEPQITG